MIPLAIPNLTGNEGRYLQDCIDSGFVSSVGPYIQRFEAMLASLSDAPAAVTTCSGTTALHAALHSVGVRPGDLVVMPTYTFIATANAISTAGADPWILDVSDTDWTLSADALETALAEKTERRNGVCTHRETGRRVSAVLPVYAIGNVPDLAGLSAVADAHGLSVVADAACALGARVRAKVEAQGIGAGQAAFTCVSFNGNKTFTTGSGGAVLGDVTRIEALRHLVSTARASRNYDHDKRGFNYRMSNMEAAVGVAQLEQFDAFLAAKHRAQDTYGRAIAGLADIVTLPPVSDPSIGTSVPWMAMVHLKGRLSGKRDALVAALNDAGIEARAFWKPMHLQPPYRDCPIEATPVADAIWADVVTLPCSTQITDDELTRTSEQLVHELGRAAS